MFLNYFFPSIVKPSNSITEDSKSICLKEALDAYSFPKDRYEIIKNLILKIHLSNRKPHIYFNSSSKEKLFTIEYSLDVFWMKKKYIVLIIVHIPQTFPDNKPEFYIKKLPYTGINPEYVKNNIINGQTFQIYYENFYHQNNYDIDNILNILNEKFNETFPLFKNKNINNVLEKEDLKVVIINSEYLNEKLNEDYKLYDNEKFKEENIELGKKINSLNIQLNEQENENKRLIEENNKLNEIIDKYEKDIKEIKDKYEKDIKEIKDKYEKDIKKIKEKQEKELEINIKNDNNSMIKLVEYMQKLEEKEKELRILKSKIPFELEEDEKIMTVIFISIDQKIHYSMICKNTDLFSRLESELYKVEEYKEFKKSENYFIVQGKKINRFETLEENGIKNSDIITLNKIDD